MGDITEAVAKKELVDGSQTALHTHAPTVLIPAGVIVMWSGATANIPSGWALCDGLEGRPNLLDKFVKGIPDADHDAGATGAPRLILTPAMITTSLRNRPIIRIMSLLSQTATLTMSLLSRRTILLRNHRRIPLSRRSKARRREMLSPRERIPAALSTPIVAARLTLIRPMPAALSTLTRPIVAARLTLIRPMIRRIAARLITRSLSS